MCVLRRQAPLCKGPLIDPKDNRSTLTVKIEELPDWSLFEEALTRRVVIRERVMTVVFEILVDCISMSDEEVHASQSMSSRFCSFPLCVMTNDVWFV